MRKNTIPAVDAISTTTTATTIDAVSPCNGDNPIVNIIDNSIDNLLDNSTHTPIKSNHDLAIQKLSESEALLNDAILQFEAAKLSVHNATTAPQPVVNMDVIDLESEAIRVAAIEAKLSLNCRTAQLVLIARRTRLQNAIQAVKNAVESVNEEVSKLLVDRMIECEKQLTFNLIGLNEFRQVASALGWRSGSLSEACEIIEADYVLTLPDVALPRRVPLPNVLALADTALNGVAPRPIEGQLMPDAGLYNRGDAGRIQPGDIQKLAEDYRDTLKVDSLIQKVVDRHDNRKFTTANARKPVENGLWVNVNLPCGGSVHAY